MTREQLARALAIKQLGREAALDVLDDRELEIFSILSLGYSSTQIETEFGVTRAETKRLKASIQRKLGLSTEVQLLQAAVRHRQRG